MKPEGKSGSGTNELLYGVIKLTPLMKLKQLKDIKMIAATFYYIDIVKDYIIL